MSIIFFSILAGFAVIIEEYLTRLIMWLRAWQRRPLNRRPRRYKFN